MKFLLLSFLFVFKVWAVEECKDLNFICLKKLKQNLLDKKESNLLQIAIKKHGYKVLFMPIDSNTPGLLSLYPFTGKLDDLKTLIKDEKFYESIPEGKNLYDFFIDHFKYINYEKEFYSIDDKNLIFVLLNLDSNGLLVYDWKNEKYPHYYHQYFEKYLHSIKKSNNYKEEVDTLISKLGDLNKNTQKFCRLKSIDQFKEFEEEYGEFYYYKSKNGLSVIDCLLKMKRHKILSYIIENEKLSYDEIRPILSQIIKAKDEDSKKLFMKIVGRIVESGQVEEFFNEYLEKYHFLVQDKVSCINSESFDTKTIIENLKKECDQAAFAEIVDLVSLAKLDYLNKGEKWHSYLYAVSDFFKEGFDYKYSDENKDTLIHHLVETNIRDIVIFIEQELNKKNKFLSYMHKNSEGFTPLHIAIKNKNIELINDYTQDYKYADKMRFPFIEYREIKNVKNKYGEKNIELIKRVPAQTVDDKIIRNKIIKRF